MIFLAQHYCFFASNSNSSGQIINKSSRRVIGEIGCLRLLCYTSFNDNLLFLMQQKIRNLFLIKSFGLWREMIYLKEHQYEKRALILLVLSIVVFGGGAWLYRNKSISKPLS